LASVEDINALFSAVMVLGPSEEEIEHVVCVSTAQRLDKTIHNRDELVELYLR
jgi:hypothetical protein